MDQLSPSQDDHRVVVGSGMSGNSGGRRRLPDWLYRVRRGLASNWRYQAAAAAIVLVCASAVVFAFVVLRSPSEPLSVATEQTEEGIKIDTDGDGTPDTIVTEDGSVQPDDQQTANGGGNGGSSSGNSESGNNSGSSSGGGSSGGSGSGGGTGGGGYTDVCPAFPAFPDDNCTGWQHTGVTLQTCVEDDGDEGDGHLEKSNVTYDGCDFANGAVVHGANVTIKRSRIQGVVNGHWSNDYDLRNLQLIDVEIIAATPEQIAAKTMVNESGGSATNGPNFTCIRCRIHYVPTGISLGDNTLIQDSYISDVTWGPGAHQAAIGAGQGNGNNSRLIHNTIQCNRWNTSAPGFQQGCSSALSLYDEPTLNDVLVQNNLFNTTGGYCTYGGGPQGTNIRYIDNRFGKKFSSSCGIFGTVSAFYGGNSGNVWTGNTWQDGSGAINP